MPRVHRFEVRPLANAGDPVGDAAQREALRLGFSPESVRSARVYLIEADLDEAQQTKLVEGLLVDPVIETGSAGASPPPAGSSLIEIHPLPGVMDPAAQSVTQAVKSLLGVEPGVSTGRRFEFAGIDAVSARTIAERVLANPVVHGIHDAPHLPEHLPQGHEPKFQLGHIPIRDLDDDALERLSRDAHLFLSLDEMRCIRDEYRQLEREPTDIELETLAQTWSEHCVHKTLKSTIRYRGEPDTPGARDPIDWSNRPGHTVHEDGSVTIDNLLKSTVAAATHELVTDGLDWTLSVFVDNAGIIAFDDNNAVCVKVETHNHPSAIEPYGGAATGIGGCIRDIIGTGLAAKPIASTDVFCVAPPELETIPAGCLQPRRILTDIVAGVRDYGNRMGIPTVNGAVWFDDRHVGNPLVFVGCVGVMPADKIAGDARPGDLIVSLGGRTGRDGIHGATFSSAELTDTHADEFAHAVQIGNAIEEKRVLDAILRARDAAGGPLFTAITDCGAGGFSSAVGEMGEKIGAEVHLDRAPLKYMGLSYTEIWISEAQERMVLAVTPDNLEALERICAQEHVELSVLGTFGTPERELVLNYRGTEVGRLPMAFLHDGIPTPTREATWTPKLIGRSETKIAPPPPNAGDALLRLLAHPNIASKHWIIRQYDHEVQGNTVIGPLGGPMDRGPMDAAVIEPVAGSTRGLAIGCGLATGLEADPYLMVLAAIDECVRNLVCVGTDPDRIAILDNFCWPSCAKPENLGSLVRAAEGCYDGAKAYRTPFVSGKDSLNNQFTTDDGTTIEIPPTLLITGIGIVPDTRQCVTMDMKQPGSALVLVTTTARPSLKGSSYDRLFDGGGGLPKINIPAGVAASRVVAQAIRLGLVRSAHDVSDGGLLCAIAEMLIAGSNDVRPIGASLEIDGSNAIDGFAEPVGQYVLEVRPEDVENLARLINDSNCQAIKMRVLGETTDTGQLTCNDGCFNLPVEALARAWRGTLDW
jgi:phosphoribosylformylglycinamidine synthase subunit PurSL